MSTTIDAAAFASECAPLAPADFIEALLRTGFSPEAYRDAWGDLAALKLSATESLAHFLRHGLDELRAAPLTLDWQALIALARLPLHDTHLKAKLLSALAAHLFDDTPQPDGAAIAERWPVIAALADAGARPYLIAGARHSNHFRLIGARDAAWLLPIHLMWQVGSVRALTEPAGLAADLRGIVNDLATLPGADSVPFLLQFGQIDLEFVYHYQRVAQENTALNLAEYRAFCDTVLDRYMEFVTGLFAPEDRLPVFQIAAFPPAISDAAWRRGHVNGDIARQESALSVPELSAGLRKLEIADLRQRTGIHAYYNAALRMACRRHGFRFVDSFTPFLGADGTLDPRYLIPEAQGAAYELNRRRTCEAIAEQLWHCLDALGPPRGLAADDETVSVSGLTSG